MNRGWMAVASAAAMVVGGSAEATIVAADITASGYTIVQCGVSGCDLPDSITYDVQHFTFNSIELYPELNVGDSYRYWEGGHNGDGIQISYTITKTGPETYVGTDFYTHKNPFSNPVGFEYTAATFSVTQIDPVPASDVPELSTWAMFIGGFGVIGMAMRRRARSNARFELRA